MHVVTFIPTINFCDNRCVGLNDESNWAYYLSGTRSNRTLWLPCFFILCQAVILHAAMQLWKWVKRFVCVMLINYLSPIRAGLNKDIRHLQLNGSSIIELNLLETWSRLYFFLCIISISPIQPFESKACEQQTTKNTFDLSKCDFGDNWN